MRFLKLPDNEDAERKKWELSQDVRDDTETLVLQGWRQIKAVVYVRDMLKGLEKSVDPEDVAAWLLDLQCTASVDVGWGQRPYQSWFSQKQSMH